MFKLMFTSTLLDIMLEELRNLDILRAILASSNKFTLFGQMEVVEIVVFEVWVGKSTKLAA